MASVCNTSDSQCDAFHMEKILWYQDTGGRLLIETASTLTFTAHLSPHQRFLLNSYHVFLSSADSIVEFLPFVILDANSNVPEPGLLRACFAICIRHLHI